MDPQWNYKSTYMENKKYDGMFLGFLYSFKYFFIFMTKTWILQWLIFKNTCYL